MNHTFYIGCFFRLILQTKELTVPSSADNSGYFQSNRFRAEDSIIQQHDSIRIKAILTMYIER